MGSRWVVIYHLLCAESLNAPGRNRDRDLVLGLCHFYMIYPRDKGMDRKFEAPGSPLQVCDMEYRIESSFLTSNGRLLL